MASGADLEWFRIIDIWKRNHDDMLERCGCDDDDDDDDDSGDGEGDDNDWGRNMRRHCSVAMEMTRVRLFYWIWCQGV